MPQPETYQNSYVCFARVGVTLNTIFRHLNPAIAFIETEARGCRSLLPVLQSICADALELNRKLKGARRPSPKLAQVELKQLCEKILAGFPPHKQPGPGYAALHRKAIEPIRQSARNVLKKIQAA